MKNIKNKILTIIFGVILSIGFNGCSNDDNDGSNISNENGREIFQPISLTVEQTNVVLTQTEAAFNLFKTINSVQGENNLFFSPLSFSIDLSMICNGATDPTQAQIKDLLGLSDISMGDVNKLNQLLLEELPIADKKVSLSLANSIWIDNGITLNNDYKNIVEQYYNATIKSVDLPTDMARKEINKWASDITHGLIPNFLEQNLSPQVTSIILNALYFNGRWSSVFSKNDTYQSTFKAPENKSKKISMMKNSFVGSYYDDGKTMKGTTLWYGNSSFGMTLIQPYTGISVDEIIDQLSAQRYNDLKKSSISADITLSLPRFNIENEIYFREILEKMGYNNIVGGNSDYSLNVSKATHLSDILQKTTIRVDEEGTEAAAVTGGLMETSSASVERPKVNLTFDSPFIFAITERSTGSVLFVGKVLNP